MVSLLEGDKRRYALSRGFFNRKVRQVYIFGLSLELDFSPCTRNSCKCKIHFQIQPFNCKILFSLWHTHISNQLTSYVVSHKQQKGGGRTGLKQSSHVTGHEFMKISPPAARHSSQPTPPVEAGPMNSSGKNTVGGRRWEISLKLVPSTAQKGTSPEEKRLCFCLWFWIFPFIHYIIQINQDREYEPELSAPFPSLLPAVLTLWIFPEQWASSSKRTRNVNGKKKKKKKPTRRKIFSED